MTPLQRFITASAMTNLADGIAVVAWGWIASLLTRDAFLVALVPVALRLPWFLLALPAGLVTDRVDRRKLILRMDALRGIAFGGAALARGGFDGRTLRLHLGEDQLLVQRAAVHADADGTAVVDRHLADGGELLVAALSRADVARVDPILVERRRARGIAREE